MRPTRKRSASDVGADVTSMANLKKVYLEITNRCNLNCAFCPGTGRKSGSLDREQFVFLAKRLTGRAEYLYFHLMGEPLAHPLLPDFIYTARELGFKPVITTNGTLLSRRSAEIIGAKPYKISISLHSFEANPPGMSFDEYIGGCLDFVGCAADNGIISVLRLWNLDGRTDSALNLKNSQILEAMRRVFSGEWREVRTGYRLGDRIFLEWGDKFDWPDINGDILSEEGFCYGLRDQIGVLSDGTVVPCCLDREGDIALGNLFDSSLEDILSGERARAVYDGFASHRCVEPLCKRCMRAGYYRA